MMAFMPLVMVWIGQFCFDMIGGHDLKVTVIELLVYLLSQVCTFDRIVTPLFSFCHCLFFPAINLIFSNETTVECVFVTIIEK